MNTNDQTRVDTLEEVKGLLRKWAKDRFETHGGRDARGAAFWDAAAHIEDHMLAAYPEWEAKRRKKAASLRITGLTDAGRRVVEAS